jgi:hypothetical protein
MMYLHRLISLIIVLSFFCSSLIALADNYNLGGWNDFGGDDGVDFSVNSVPNAPVLVSPDDNSSLITAPEFSATFTDDDMNDTGTTNYRISSTTAQDCLDNQNITNSGTSAETTSNSENTIWTPDINTDGAYFWCAQNNDGMDTSDWTSMGVFTLNIPNPIITNLAITSDNTDYFYAADTDLNDNNDKIYFNSLDGQGANQAITIAISLTENNPDYTTGETAFNDTPLDQDDETTATLAYTIEQDASSFFDLTITATNKANKNASIDIDFLADNTSPISTSEITAETLGNNDWYTTNTTITINSTDTDSGIKEIQYCIDTENTCAPDQIYSAPVLISDEGINYLRYQTIDNVDNIEATQSLEIKIDQTSPTSGMLTAPFGGEIFTSGESNLVNITWNVADFTDAISGLNDIPLTLEYSTNEILWNEIAIDVVLNDETYAWETPDLTSDAIAIRLTATDNAGNFTTIISPEFALSAHDNWNTLELISGNHQIGKMNAELAEELKVRVSNGADIPIFADLGAVELTFTINAIPADSLANGQILSAGIIGQNFSAYDDEAYSITTETDANGEASVKLRLGDRAGNYQVVTNFPNCATPEIERTFTSTELEYFQLHFIKPSSTDLKLDPELQPSNSKSLTLVLDTNAASYNLTLGLNSLPANSEASVQITNWLSTKGFGWDNNNTGTQNQTSNSTAFDLDNPTNVIICSGETCQGPQEFVIDLNAVVDYLDPEGDYFSDIEVKGAEVVF